MKLTTADYFMPKDYLDSVVEATMPKRRQPADHLDSIQLATAYEARNRASRRTKVYTGQPSMDAPINEWYIWAVEGEVQLLDDKTVNTAEAVEVTATADGLNVGETELAVGGDDDGYRINIEDGTITGLENIGSESGVTIGGLDDASVLSDKAGSITVGDKTFKTSDHSVTWIDEGR